MPRCVVSSMLTYCIWIPDKTLRPELFEKCYPLTYPLLPNTPRNWRLCERRFVVLIFTGYFPITESKFRCSNNSLLYVATRITGPLTISSAPWWNTSKVGSSCILLKFRQLKVEHQRTCSLRRLECFGNFPLLNLVLLWAYFSFTTLLSSCNKSILVHSIITGQLLGIEIW